MLKEKNYNVPLTKLAAIDPSKPVNLVLSGGGEKGVAHIALLEKLEEMGLKINKISACSAGSIVGAMYASGMRPQNILEFFKTTPLFRYSWVNPLKAGIFESGNYADLLKDHIKPTFEELEIPLYIVATNMEKCESHYFHEGPIMQSLLASCAVPAIFHPIEIEGALYSDGGVLDNFPIFPFKEDNSPILGSYVAAPNPAEKKDLNTILKLTAHAAELLSYSGNKYKFESTAYTAIFPLGDLEGFEMKEVPEIYQRAKDFLNDSFA